MIATVNTVDANQVRFYRRVDKDKTSSCSVRMNEHVYREARWCWLKTAADVSRTCDDQMQRCNYSCHGRRRHCLFWWK